MKRLSFFTLLMLTACNLAPRYERQDASIPEAFRCNNETEESIANTAWWEAFGDETLNTLIQKALKNNKDLQIAIFRVQEYYGQYMVARSPLFPEFDLKADSFRELFSNDNGLTIPGVSPLFSDFAASINLSYEIDFWGALRNQSKAGYMAYLAEVENRRTVVLSLVSAVAESYIYLRQLDLEMTISQETLETRRESLSIAIDRFEGGLTSEIEVAQAASLFDEALAVVKNLERRIPQQENLLSILLGENPGEIPRGKGIDAFTMPQKIPTGLPSDLLARRPDIVAAEKKLIATHANIGIARAAFFPTIDLFGFYGTDSKSLSNFFSPEARTWQIGGNLLQIIFQGGKLTGQLKAAKAEQKEALYNYEQKILTALKEVNDSLIGHQKAKEITVVDEASVEALQEYVTLSWLRYYEGQTQYLTVLDAERSLFSGQIDLAKALGDQFTTLVNLYKALGGGWVIAADEIATQSTD